jgi:hypothetical protein
MLCELTQLLLPPALTHAHEHSANHLDYTGLVPQMGHAFRAPPLLCKDALRPVRGLHILAMPRGHLAVIETGLGVSLQAPVRLRAGVLLVGPQGLLAALAFFKRRRIPHVDH